MAAPSVSLHARRMSPLTRWILPALVVSLVLHLLFFWWARERVVHHMSPEFYDRIVPRTFRIERAQIDPKLLEPAADEKKSVLLAPVPVDLPKESISFGAPDAPATGQPAAPPLTTPLLADKPSIHADNASSLLDAAQASGARSLLNDSAAMEEALLADKTVPGPVTLEDALSQNPAGGAPMAPEGALAGESQPGFSNLDELLARTGPLSPETAPILMPTDLLFDYDSADLREAAIESLAKLATLIRRNPHARFVIEGHTDSFGSDAYNLDLSARRAEAVGRLLVLSMGIPADRIAARGYGKSRLIAPATGTIEEQQINRRVEIVIHTEAVP